MPNNLNEIKINLIHFFTRVEHFRTVQDFEDNTNVYLIINKKHVGYNVIRITLDDPISDNTVLELIKSKLKDSKHEDVNSLTISLLNDTVNKIDTSKNIYISSFNDVNKKLVTMFPSLKRNVFYDESSEKQNHEIGNSSIEQEINKQFSEPLDVDKINEQFASINNISQKNNITSTIISILFCFIPAFLFIFYFFESGQSNLLFLQSTASANVFFGATNRTLFIDVKQYWRIFTYGFSVFNVGFDSGGSFWGIVDLIVLFLFLPILVRTSARMQKASLFWIEFILTYLILGLFFSLCFTNLMFSGSIIIMAIIVGQSLVITWGKNKTVGSILLRMRLIYPVIFLIILALINNNTADYISIPSGVVLGSAITYLLTYNYKNTTSYLLFPIISVASYILPILASFFIRFDVPTQNQYVMIGLAEYTNHKFFSMDITKLNNIYSHIGWNVKLCYDIDVNSKSLIYWFLSS